MRVKTPSRPSSKQELLVMRISMDGLIDPSTKRSVVVPTLDLHVNPQSIEMSYRKNITRSRTRGGFVEEHFGDELDVLNISGSTGGFLGMGTGVTTQERHRTLAMVNFQEILALYRNNACVYDQRGIIISQGYISITWDTYRFNGQFVNFSWAEEAGSPYRYTFDFSFEVSRTTFVV